MPPLFATPGVPEYSSSNAVGATTCGLQGDGVSALLRRVQPEDVRCRSDQQVLADGLAVPGKLDRGLERVLGRTLVRDRDDRFARNAVRNEERVTVLDVARPQQMGGVAI